MIHGKPLVIELFAGSFGWSAGCLEQGWLAAGFDLEHHPWHGPVPANAMLAIQDVLDLDGRQFRNADLILASPPCQAYSYMAMPWSRGKKMAEGIRHDSAKRKELNRLFRACFRIQREACEAAGRHIPMIVENVRGAQPWVGKAKWNYGSFYLWGDVPAIMPFGSRRVKSRISCAPIRFDERIATTPEEADALHYRMPDQKYPADCSPRLWKDRHAPRLNAGEHEIRNGDLKGTGGSWCGDYQAQKAAQDEAIKQGGDWLNQSQTGCISRRFSSRSQARKAASAQIAKIPLPLSRWIAQVFKP
jgi:hypothetical protein